MTDFVQPKQPSRIKRWLNLPIRHLQQAIGSLGELWRTPLSSLMTIFVLGISLTLPATLHLFVKNAQQISQHWDSASQITLFLELDLSANDSQQLLQRIRLYPEVADVRFIDKAQALAEFKKASGFGEALDYLPENPLPSTILVTPTERASQVLAAQELLDKLNQEKGVEQGKLDLEWLTRLQAMAHFIADIVLSLALLLCVSVVLIIGNTIRLAILNQKNEIAVMKLVGATDAFIQRPFLYTGMWYGLSGGMIAIIVVTLLAHFLANSMAHVVQLYQSQFSLQTLSLAESLTLLVSAIFLGLLGSYISVKRHIKQIEPTAD